MKTLRILALLALCTGSAYAQDVPVRAHGAKCDGVTNDAAAFTKAASHGRTVSVPKGGDCVINTPVSMGNIVGEGADDGQSLITLTGTGQLKPVDEHVSWRGFKIRSSVNSLTFVKVEFSYFHFTDFKLEKTGGATGQVGIHFDTTTRSIYHNHIAPNHITGIATPYSITGGNSFNNNQLGGEHSYVQTFTSAIVSSNSLILSVNKVKGYFESGTNFLSISAGTVRDNVFDVWLDGVTQAISSSVAIAENLWPQVTPALFVTSGAGAVSAQVFDKKIRFRAYLSSDQTINDNTETKVQWNAETFDPASVMTLSPNFRFDVPRAMKALCVAQADISANLANGDRVQVSLYKNGALHAAAKEYVAGGTNGARPRITDMLDLAKSDFVEVFAFADETAGANTHTVTGATTHTFFTCTEL